MPAIQIRISPLADSHVVRWKGIRDYVHKSEAINDLLERVDVEALLKGISNTPALARYPRGNPPLDGEGLTSSEPAPQKQHLAPAETPQRVAPSTQRSRKKEART